MQPDISTWLKEFADKIKSEFKDNLVFLGLQGSYGRGEAADESDIDVVAIFQFLDISILNSYKKIVSSMNLSEKVCGFVCGVDELKGWPSFDVFTLYFDTVPIFGKLDSILRYIPSKADAKVAYLASASAIFHGACHNYLFDECKKANLLTLYKSVFFMLRAKYYFETGRYISSKKSLMEVLKEDDRKIMAISLDALNTIKNDEESIEKYSGLLIDYCSRLLSVK